MHNEKFHSFAHCNKYHLGDKIKDSKKAKERSTYESHEKS
jgi:hypothetical protein